MISRLNKLITYSFLALFFLVPLILYPNTSELFEFNKMVVTYSLTVIIASLWLAKMVVAKKFVFKRSLLDIPLIIFLVSQLLSTIISFDPRTSLLGYYSRFHGGLLSSISYALLYWAFVSNLDKEAVKKSVYALLATAVPVSIYGVLQHFGIDKEVWVQDVQNRVFSTFGQPNWLAAWIVAILPLTWYYTIKRSEKIYLSLTALLFLAFLYTKSRSGLLGFAAAFVIFWGFTFLKEKRAVLGGFIKSSSVILILLFLTGTPWTPSVSELVSQQEPKAPQKQQGPALEVGGTESGEIRKIVWTGAFDIWKNYPILGTGVETFAYSYYNFRPETHNLVSEWDFLYNKAHNEYLNIAATTGTIGLLSYLLLAGATIYIFFRKKSLFSYALMAGYISILVTNFFGFSVVPVALLFFLFPAITVAKNSKKGEVKEDTVNTGQKIALYLIAGFCLYLLFIISRYWYADYIYAGGKRLNDAGNPIAARELLLKSKNMSPNEAIYWEELSDATAEMAVLLFEDGQEEKATDTASKAVQESEMAVSLSPKNVNLKRYQASMFIKLSSIDQNYLLEARNSLVEAISLAPTDAKLYYNLGLTEARIGNIDEAKNTLKHTIEIKKDYRDARLAYALILADEGRVEEAKEQLIYILENINPNDKLVKQQLEELGGR